MAGKIAHEGHLPQAAAGVFNKPVPWLQLADEGEGVLHQRVSVLSRGADRLQGAIFGLPAVVGYGGDGVGCAGRGCPNHIWIAKTADDFIRRYV